MNLSFEMKPVQSRHGHQQYKKIILINSVITGFKLNIQDLLKAFAGINKLL